MSYDDPQVTKGRPVKHHRSMHKRLRNLTATVSALLGSAALATGRAHAADLAAPAEIHATLDAYAGAHPHAVLIGGVVDGTNARVYTARGKRAVTAVDVRLRFQIGP